MKRSKMVNVIHENISIELKTTEEFNLKDCDKLLAILEEGGMLPPFNSWSFHTDGDNADENSVLYRTWEKE